MYAMKISEGILNFIEDLYGLHEEFPASVTKAEMDYRGGWEIEVRLNSLEFHQSLISLWEKNPEVYERFVSNWEFEPYGYRYNHFDVYFEGGRGDLSDVIEFWGKPRPVVVFEMNTPHTDVGEDFIQDLKDCFNNLKVSLEDALIEAQEEKDDQN